MINLSSIQQSMTIRARKKRRRSAQSNMPMAFGRACCCNFWNIHYVLYKVYYTKCIIQCVSYNVYYTSLCVQVLPEYCPIWRNRLGWRVGDKQIHQVSILRNFNNFLRIFEEKKYWEFFEMLSVFWEWHAFVEDALLQ